MFYPVTYGLRRRNWDENDDSRSAVIYGETRRTHSRWLIPRKLIFDRQRVHEIIARALAYTRKACMPAYTIQRDCKIGQASEFICCNIPTSESTERWKDEGIKPQSWSQHETACTSDLYVRFVAENDECCVRPWPLFHWSRMFQAML